MSVAFSTPGASSTSSVGRFETDRSAVYGCGQSILTRYSFRIVVLVCGSRGSEKGISDSRSATRIIVSLR